MPQIPVVIRDNSRVKSKHPSEIPCTNHGNAMNCPSGNCPGVVQLGAADEDAALDINARVMHDRIRDAVSEFKRLHPERDAEAAHATAHAAIESLYVETSDESDDE